MNPGEYQYSLEIKLYKYPQQQAVEDILVGGYKAAVSLPQKGPFLR
jgi:hypothetical protein